MAGAAQVINSLLQADSAVAAITAIVAPGQIPPSKNYPAITYDQISSSPLDHKDGNSEMDSERWQITCRSKKAIQMLDLAEAVRTALDGKAGTTAGVTYQQIKYLNRRTDYDSDQKVHRANIDFLIMLTP